MNLGSEDEYTEFKASMTQIDKGLIAITAMLNRHGKGTVYIGVSDDGEIKGIDIGEGTLERIRRQISDYIEPRILPDIAVLESDDGKRYIRIFAMNSTGVFSYDGRYYIRNVSSNERVPVDVLFRLYQSRGFDAIKEQPSVRADLTFTRFKEIAVRYGIHWRDDDAFFQSHGMKVSDGSFNLVAYLMSDQNDFTIQIIRYAGTDKSTIHDRSDLGHRCLIDSINDVIDKIGLLMEHTIDTSVRPRKKVPMFDMESFTESWINACVHNNWLLGIPPSIFIFDDRMEIQSYGSIPIEMTKEQFFTGHSHPVNKSLFDILSLVDLTEQSGHGVPTIVDAYGRDVFDFFNDMIVVKIPFTFEPAFVQSRKATARNTSDITVRQNEVLRYLLENGSITLSQAAEALGIGLSSVKKDVGVLKGLGLIRNAGTTRKPLWIAP